MSQQQTFSSGSIPGNPNIEFTQGNDLVSVAPDPATHVIKIVGLTTQGVSVTNSAANTEQITVADATTAQKGVVLLADNLETIAGTLTTKAITPDDLKAKLGVQTTHGLPYGAGTAAAIAWLGEASDGKIPIGSTGNPPVLANITSTDTSIIVTNGPGSINLSINNQLLGTATTTGFTTANINIAIPVPLNSTTMIRSIISGYDSTSNLGIGGELIGAVRNTAGVLTVLGLPDITKNNDNLLNDATWTIVTVGTNAFIQVKGTASGGGVDVINWRASINIISAP